MVDRNIKKTVVADWQKSFPQLSMYTQDKLYKIIGNVVIIGIELVKLPRTDEYRPYFVMYPLWKEDLKTNLDTPIILREFYNYKRLQYNIPYVGHHDLFKEVIDMIGKQAPLPIEGDVPLQSILTAIDDYTKVLPLSAAPDSYLQAICQESKLKIALYAGVSEVQDIMQQIRNRNWDTNHFNLWGKKVKDWIQGMEGTIADRGDFLKQIEINRQDNKLLKLNTSRMLF